MNNRKLYESPEADITLFRSLTEIMDGDDDGDVTIVPGRESQQEIDTDPFPFTGEG